MKAARLLFAAAMVSSPLWSASLSFNFEGFADSTILTGQYPGVVFSNAVILTSGISLNEFEFPPHSDTNVASDNGGLMTISFAAPVTTVAGYFTYGQRLTLNAFNVSNALAATTMSLFSNNEAISGSIESSANEFISLNAVSGISRVTILGSPVGGSFTLDDLQVTMGDNGPVNPIPEPSTFILFSIPLLVFALKRKFVRLAVLLSTFASASVFGLPSITASSALPAAIPINSGIPVTVTATISDGSVIPQSVVLIQYDASGTPISVLGTLHDDGLNGDATASDGIFSVETPLPSNSVKVFNLRVSAAFKNVLLRSLSTVMTVRVTDNLTLSDPTTKLSLTVPDVGVPQKLVFLSSADNDTIETPYLDVQVFDSRSSSYVSAFEIVIDDNVAGLSLGDWFRQNVDADGLLIDSEAVVSRSFPGGTQALVLQDAIPTDFGGPSIENGYLMLSSDKRILTVRANEENPLAVLGYSSLEIAEVTQRIIASIAPTGQSVTVPGVLQQRIASSMSFSSAAVTANTPASGCRASGAPACGTTLSGNYNGVYAISNGPCYQWTPTACRTRNGAFGQEFQCPEFVKRAMVPTRTSWPSGDAIEFWNKGLAYTFERHVNGSTDRPQVGDIMVWAGIPLRSNYGHVAIVTAVSPTGQVDITEQNWDKTGRFQLQIQTPFAGVYYISNRTVNGRPIRRLIGWLREPNPTNPPPIQPPAPGANTITSIRCINDYADSYTAEAKGIVAADPGVVSTTYTVYATIPNYPPVNVIPACFDGSYHYPSCTIPAGNMTGWNTSLGFDSQTRVPFPVSFELTVNQKVVATASVTCPAYTGLQ